MHGSRLDDEEEEEEEVLMDAGGVFLLELDEGHPDADAAEARQEARQRQTGERTQVRRGGGRTGAEEEKAALARRFSAERQEVIELLRAHTCYDLIPASGKIIVLDTELVVKAALHALVENRIKSAPLWDSRRGDLVGMITVTDFIDVIRYFFHHKEERERVFKEEEYQISTWRSQYVELRNSEKMVERPMSLIHAEPDESICNATLCLLRHHLHRIPIIDQENNSVLHMVSMRRILRFVVCNSEESTLFSHTMQELGIGTFNNVVTVLQDTPLIVVLNLLIERKISAVPLVDENGVARGLYTKSHAAALAQCADIFAELEKPVQDFVEPELVETCQRSDTLQHVLVDTMVNRNLRRVICVDSSNCVAGIIALSDIMSFILFEEDEDSYLSCEDA